MKLENSIFEESYLTGFSQTGVHNVLTNKSFLSLMETIAGTLDIVIFLLMNLIKKINLGFYLTGNCKF